MSMPGLCVSNVGRLNERPTYTVIGTDCFTGPGKIYNDIAWIVLHEVNIIIFVEQETITNIMLLN